MLIISDVCDLRSVSNNPRWDVWEANP
jgi:hypothetical protein